MIELEEGYRIRLQEHRERKQEQTDNQREYARSHQ